MSGTSPVVDFLYGNALGRLILKAILASHADKIAVAFLSSRLSKGQVKRYAKRNGIEMSDEELDKFRTFREFFGRARENEVDLTPERLISPCDSRLSVFRLDENAGFDIKKARYALSDLFQDAELAKEFQGGDVLIFRLCPSDYHHYCYIDDAFQGPNHMIPGKLHSVQPICCETYPVYALNRRCWTLLETEHFGRVVQTEVGALVVGGIVNPKENVRVKRGEEKRRFDLAGSTIVLFFQKDKIRLRPELVEKLKDGEVQVKYGEWIGNQYGAE